MTDDEQVFNKAKVKGDLAALGATVKSDAEITVMAPPKPGQSGAIILLDRVADVKEPDYCSHGYAQCVVCYEYCWLGHKTAQVVSSGEAFPVCIDCGTKLAEQNGLSAANSTHVKDHKRADGPHD